MYHIYKNNNLTCLTLAKYKFNMTACLRISKKITGQWKKLEFTIKLMYNVYSYL